MEYPKVGSVWINKTFSYEFIIILDKSMSNCTRKKIVYKYLRTGHTGGCNSCEWFYEDWKLSTLQPSTRLVWQEINDMLKMRLSNSQ